MLWLIALHVLFVACKTLVCKQGLTAYKVPKILEFRQSLPKSLIGKVLRRELCAEETVHEKRGKHASWFTFKP